MSILVKTKRQADFKDLTIAISKVVFLRIFEEWFPVVE
jgi:hypothetical protein